MIWLVKPYRPFFSLYGGVINVNWINQVRKCSCPHFPLCYRSSQGGRNDGGAGSVDGFQGRIFILFLLALSLMRNRFGYFKISPYLNLLLLFSSPLA